ncbi:VCBS repeat-containing protein, partial [Candidatus Berkelbacteria bacterium]|nr:VCBS repeat-containing protein [Candidatus Berkelbacteria bacterium]
MAITGVVVVILAVRPSADTLLLGSESPIQFASAENLLTFTGGGNAYGLATADLNEDGKPDLAVTQVTNEKVGTKDEDVAYLSIILNLGSGAYGAPTHLPIPKQANGKLTTARSIVATDVDSDGHTDLVVAAQERKELLVWKGVGDGTVIASTPIVTPIQPGLIQVGNVAGDEHADLVIAGENQLVVLRAHDENEGQFEAMSSLSVPGSGSVDLALADLNADNRLDLVTATYNERRVTSFLNTGDGFAEAKVTESSINPRGLTVGDFTGDSKGDLILMAHNITAPTGSVDGFQLLPGLGDGKFGAPTTVTGYPTAFAPHRGPYSQNQPVDLDGDGDLDLIVLHAFDHRAGPNSVTVGLNDGRGTFSVSGWVATSGSGVLTQPPDAVNLQSAVVADLNADGALDLVTASVGPTNVQRRFTAQGQPRYGDVSVAYGNPEIKGAFASPSVSRTSPLLAGFRDGAIRARGLALQDVTGDGRLDALVLGRGVELFGGTKTGGWQPGQTALPPVLTLQEQAGLQLTDFDQDGTTDLAWTGRDTSNRKGRHVVAFGSGNGRFGGVSQVLPAGAKAARSTDRLAQPDLIRCSSLRPGHECWFSADTEDRTEWSSAEERVGAWSELVWNSPRTVKSIILADRDNGPDHIVAGQLVLSDGTVLDVGEPPDNGTPITIELPAPTQLTSVRFDVTAVSQGTENVGLRQFKVILAENSETNLAASATVTCSSEDGTETCARVTDADYGTRWHAGTAREGSTVTLAWPAPVTVGRVVLTDYPSLSRGIAQARLQVTKADGSTFEVATGPLPNADNFGTPFTVVLPEVVQVTSLTVRIDETTGSAESTGLSELEVYANPADPTIERNLAREAAVSCSSQLESFYRGRNDCPRAVDGSKDPARVRDGQDWGEWVATAKTGSLDLTWQRPVTLGRVILWDRPQGEHQVKAGKLTLIGPGDIKEIPDVSRSINDQLQLTTTKRAYHRDEVVTVILENLAETPVTLHACAGTSYSITRTGAAEPTVAEAVCAAEGEDGFATQVAQTLAGQRTSRVTWDPTNGGTDTPVAGSYTFVTGVGEAQVSVPFTLLDAIRPTTVIDVPELPNDGAGHTVTLPAATVVEALRFEITDSSSDTTGLLELEALEALAPSASSSP